MYHITDYTKKKAKEIGVEVRPSRDSKKKLDVYKGDELVASIGAIGYGDYPTFLQTEGKEYADKRRLLYHKRHTKDSLGEYLALWLLW
jgi:hypothetical protein